MYVLKKYTNDTNDTNAIDKRSGYVHAALNRVSQARVTAMCYF